MFSAQPITQPQPEMPTVAPATTSANPPPVIFAGVLQVLVEMGVLSTDQAQLVTNQELTTGKSVEEIVLQQQLASETAVVKAKAVYNHIPFVEVDETTIAPEALTRLDESVAKRYQVLPFAFDPALKKLKVAMADPLNRAAIDFIEKKTGLDLEEYYALPSELSRVITQRYAQDLSADVTKALQESSLRPNRLPEQLETNQKGGLVKAAPINKIVNTILDYAMQARASDVHIEPQQEKTRVRYRIDGILRERLTLPRTVHEAVVSRIKILSDLKIDEKRLPQDGRFDYQSQNKEVDLRVSTLPTIHGEKVVMRLLQKNAAVPGLDDLGLSGIGLDYTRRAIKVPHGIVLVTGPTGSGKTTTLYSILNIINQPGVNIMTLEDPVEYEINGVTQVQINTQAGLTFASGLRSFLRQDPDIIMVGEIRDSETAELAIQASLTGHLVFSTLHTNSAAGALPRLIDMEVEPFLLSSSITLAIGQRVVRQLNKAYIEEYQPDAAVIEDIKQVLGPNFEKWCQQHGKDPQQVVLYRAKTDRPPTESEYQGRIGIFEVMSIDDEIKHLINQRAPSEELEKKAIEKGTILMKQDGYLKALEGITTIEEVLRVAEVKL